MLEGIYFSKKGEYDNRLCILPCRFTLEGKLRQNIENFTDEEIAELEDKYVDFSKASDAEYEAGILASQINFHCQNFTDEEIVKNGVIIKTKMSRSKWYDNAGEFHARSMYETYVHKDVEKTALKLQEIRRSMQGNEYFDFGASTYRTVVIRTADHPSLGWDGVYYRHGE